jgi:hypothetical protein
MPWTHTLECKEALACQACSAHHKTMLSVFLTPLPETSHMHPAPLPPSSPQPPPPAPLPPSPPPTSPSPLQERTKPSLHARCYLRLGLYEWHHADAAEQHLAHCMDLLRVRQGWDDGAVQSVGPCVYHVLL